jgi:hypothetical protein
MGCRSGPSPGSGAAEHPQPSIGQVQKVLIFPHVGAALVQKCAQIRPIDAGVAPCQELLELGQWVVFWKFFFSVLLFSSSKNLRFPHHDQQTVVLAVRGRLSKWPVPGILLRGHPTPLVAANPTRDFWKTPPGPFVVVENGLSKWPVPGILLRGAPYPSRHSLFAANPSFLLLVHRQRRLTTHCVAKNTK